MAYSKAIRMFTLAALFAGMVPVHAMEQTQVDDAQQEDVVVDEDAVEETVDAKKIAAGLVGGTAAVILAKKLLKTKEQPKKRTWRQVIVDNKGRVLAGVITAGTAGAGIYYFGADAYELAQPHLATVGSFGNEWIIQPAANSRVAGAFSDWVITPVSHFASTASAAAHQKGIDWGVFAKPVPKGWWS